MHYSCMAINCSYTQKQPLIPKSQGQTEKKIYCPSQNDQIDILISWVVHLQVPINRPRQLLSDILSYYSLRAVRKQDFVAFVYYTWKQHTSVHFPTTKTQSYGLAHFKRG